MTVQTVAKFLALTIGLTIGVAVTLAASYRADIARNWEAKRCDPGVVPIAGIFKPDNDPRTATQFAKDNWDECRKEYVQAAIRVAAEAPKEMAAAEEAVVGVAKDVADKIGDVFVGIWRFCYEAYSTFVDDMKGTAKLMHNFLINLHQVVDRLQAAALSIVYGLIALVVSVLNSVQVVLIAAIVIIGILIALQIILFFLLLPISGLIITVTAIVSVAVVVIATAISAAMVAEMYTTEGCFVTGTPVLLADGKARPIEQLLLGDILVDGARVQAIHRFVTTEGMYDIDGIQVSGNHMVVVEDESSRERLVPVCEYPAAQEVAHRSWFFGLAGGGAREIWCLTTSTRRIYCEGKSGAAHVFADWEEIPDSEIETLRRWEATVWRTLNPDAPAADAPTSYMSSEAAIASDCFLRVVDWRGALVWRRAADIAVGTRIVENNGGDVTVVTGIVDISPELIYSAVALPSGEHGSQVVSGGSWILAGLRAHPAQWDHPLDYRPVEVAGRKWRHLYTASGRLLLSGGWSVRDASEVGMKRLDELVEEIILERP
jgi:hypothetical protein